MATRKLTREQVAKKLNANLAYVNAFAQSGLLGFHDGKLFDADRLSDLKRYGTQWHESLGERVAPLHKLPSPPGWENTPTGFPGETIIGTRGFDVEAANNDQAWIAHFYLRPNPFFFPDPLLVGPISPIPIRLEEAVNFVTDDFAVRLHPHPDGTLALAATSGPLIKKTRPIEIATDRISRVLDYLSYRYEHPLYVCQRLWIGVPSGAIRTEFTRRGPPQTLRLGEFIEHEPLAEALSLYREGLTGRTPFHQFLCFWRVRENVVKRRGAWCQDTGRSVPKVEPERFPKAKGFLQFGGRPFDAARKELGRAYRTAIAHGERQDGNPRILSRGADMTAVARHVPLVRYVARTLIRNFEGALSKAIEEADGPG